MAKLTPITKQQLSEIGINFIAVPVPALPLSINKTVLIKFRTFPTIESAKEELSKCKVIVIFDTETVYGDNAIQESSKVPVDCFYLRYSDEVSIREAKHFMTNYKSMSDAVYHFKVDFSNFK